MTVGGFHVAIVRVRMPNRRRANIILTAWAQVDVDWINGARTEEHDREVCAEQLLDNQPQKEMMRTNRD